MSWHSRLKSCRPAAAHAYHATNLALRGEPRLLGQIRHHGQLRRTGAKAPGIVEGDGRAEISGGERGGNVQNRDRNAMQVALRLNPGFERWRGRGGLA